MVELLPADTGYRPGVSIRRSVAVSTRQTITLAQRSLGAMLSCLDVSADSHTEARYRVTVMQAEVVVLPRAAGPLAAGRFEHVFVCFLLEHLPRPGDALTRLRAMLKPGGTITVVGGDHGSIYFHSDSEPARDAIDCQLTLQHHAGGDAPVGGRLSRC